MLLVIYYYSASVFESYSMFAWWFLYSSQNRSSVKTNKTLIPWINRANHLYDSLYLCKHLDREHTYANSFNINERITDKYYLIRLRIYVSLVYIPINLSHDSPGIFQLIMFNVLPVYIMACPQRQNNIHFPRTRQSVWVMVIDIKRNVVFSGGLAPLGAGLDIYSTVTTKYGWSLVYIWGLASKKILRAGTSNYIPLKLWDVITCPYFWHSSPHNELDFYVSIDYCCSVP